MPITSAAFEDIIGSDLWNEIASLANGTTPASGTAPPFKPIQYNDLSTYSVTIGNQNTVAGLALKVQYGLVASPTTLLTVAKAGVAITVPLTLAASGQGILRQDQTTLNYYYGSEGTGASVVELIEGSDASPTTSDTPALLWLRRQTPTTTDGHVFSNYEFASTLQGAIAATAVGSRFSLHNLVARATCSATGGPYGVIAFTAHANGSATGNANAINALCYASTPGGQAAEFDIINNGAGTAGTVVALTPAQAAAATSPATTGTTGLNLLGQAAGTSQINNLVITGGTGANTFTVTVVGTVWTGAAISGVTAAIAGNAVAATVQAAVLLITNIPAGSLTVSGAGTSGSPFVFTWGGHLEHTLLAVSALGAGGATATMTVPTPGTFTGRFNEQAILVQASGVTQGFRSGFRPMPFSIADGGYANDFVGVSGTFGTSVAAARTMRSPNNALLYWLNNAGNADIGGITVDASDRVALQATAGIALQSAGGATTYATFAAGTFAINGGAASGQALNIQHLTELTTIAAAATTDTAIQFPAGSIGVGVTVRVTTVIPTSTSFDVGIAGATTRYGATISPAATTTNASPGTTNPSIYATATSVRLTMNGGNPAANTGRVRVTLHYISLVAPTV